MATLNNAKILDDINGAWDVRDADANENDRRLLTAAVVLLAAADDLEPSYTAAERIVRPLVEEVFYQVMIDKALDSRDFTKLGRLRGSFLFLACNRLVLPVPFTVLQEGKDKIKPAPIEVSDCDGGCSS
jgi:hypothetical protein